MRVDILHARALAATLGRALTVRRGSSSLAICMTRVWPTLRVESVARPAALDERAEQFGQRIRITEIVQVSYRLRQAGPRCVLALSQVLVRNMEMDEVARRANSAVNG